MEGDQHLSSTTRRHWSAQHVTACFVLQNKLGAERWSTASGLVHEMRRVFQNPQITS